jgi:CHAD domain-containing protein
VQPAVRERELKLAAPWSYVVPNLADDGLGVLTMQDLPELVLTSTYHDTADLRLARNGVTLRYRTGEQDGPIWTLKLRVAGRDATERDEHTFHGDPEPVPGEAADLVTAYVRSTPIVPVASLSTRRRRWLLCDADQALAELVDDDVSVLDGERVVARFRELELESRGPDLNVLRPIANRLRRAGAVLAEPLPKAVRALGPRASAEPDVSPLAVNARDPASRAVQAALAAGLHRLITNDPLTRLGEVEGLHQMRVATRRLRSDLRTFRTLLDEAWATGLSEELRWIGDLLGAVRDADVQLGRLESMAPDLVTDLSPICYRLTDGRERGRKALLAALRSERYVSLLDRMVDAVRNPMITGDAAQPSVEVLPGILAKAWKRIRREANALRAGGTDAEYHAVRIRAKRLRYAAEAIGPALPNKHRDAVATVAGKAAGLQDLLGGLHDDIVMRDQLEGTRNETTDSSFAYAAGRLVERCEVAAADARRRYPKSWKRVTRAWRAV